MSEVEPVAPAEVAPEAAPAAPETRPDQAPAVEQDFKKRFLTDPEHAWDQYTSMQAKFTREREASIASSTAIELAKKFGGEDISAGAQRIYEILTEYNGVRANPQMAKIVDQYNSTGRVPGNNDMYDQELDPEPEDPRDVELRELRGTVTRLQGNVTGLQGHVAEDKITGHLKQFCEEYELSDEEKATVLKGVLSDVKQYAGTPQGQQLLDSDLRYETVETIALPKIKTFLKEIGMRKAQRESQRKAEMATGAVPGVRTSGREETDSGTVANAVKAFAAEEGIDLYAPPIRG